MVPRKPTKEMLDRMLGGTMVKDDPVLKIKATKIDGKRVMLNVTAADKNGVDMAGVWEGALHEGEFLSIGGIANAFTFTVD